MEKGLSTKVNILETGLKQVRKFGFEALSIGELAKCVGMSKSGLFAHFKSKETLQMMILDYAAENFTLKVFKPAFKAKRGLPRLEALMENWVNWSSKNKYGGCPLISASVEFDDKPGKVKETTQKHLSSLHATLTRTIEIVIEEGEFKKDTDAQALAYEIFSNIIGLHLYKRLLQNDLAESNFQKSFENLIERNKA